MLHLPASALFTDLAHMARVNLPPLKIMQVFGALLGSAALAILFIASRQFPVLSFDSNTPQCFRSVKEKI